MLDFRMYTFLSVYRNKGFTKAALELNITQPAVSQHIRYLEQYYGVKLFSYEGKKLKFTQAGELLYEAGNSMANDEQALKQRLLETEQTKKNIRFGVTLTIGDYVIGKCIRSYLRRHPDTQIHMQVENTSVLIGKLKAGEIDFAVVEGHLKKNEFFCQTFSKEKYIAVCAPDYQFHRYVKRVEDLLEEKLIIREAGSGTREILERSLESRNLVLADFPSVTEIGSIAVIKQMVEEGLGITFLYEAAVKEELKKGNLKRIILEDFNLIHDFSFISTKNSIFEGNEQSILKELQEVLVS